MVAFQSSPLLLVGSSFSKSVPITACPASQSQVISSKWYMREPRTRLPFDERFRRPSRIPSDFSLPSRSTPAIPDKEQSRDEEKESDVKKVNDVKEEGTAKEASVAKKGNDVKVIDTGNKERAINYSDDVKEASKEDATSGIKEGNGFKEASVSKKPSYESGTSSVSDSKEPSNVEEVSDTSNASDSKEPSNVEEVSDTLDASDSKEPSNVEEVSDTLDASDSKEPSNVEEVRDTSDASDSKEPNNVKGVSDTWGASAMMGISDTHEKFRSISNTHPGTGGKPADRTLSTVGRVDLAGAKTEASDVKESNDEPAYEGGTNDHDSNSGSGDDSGNDDSNEGDQDGDGDDREELVRSLRLTEAEGKEATLDELRNLKSASKTPLLGSLALNWPPLRNRLAANRRLYLQLGVEITVGCVTKTIAEVQGRGERFWKEFDFYLSDMALEIFGDALLVWLLSPVVPWRSGGIALLENLPRHAGQIGPFSIPQRLGGYLYKGVQFGTAGFLSSVAGHGLTRWLVSIRDKNEGPERLLKDGVELAPVLPTSLAWGSFMMISSNSRYQAVNGFEQRVLEPFVGANGALLTALTFALRLGNCYVGGLHWLPWAKMWNLQ